MTLQNRGLQCRAADPGASVPGCRTGGCSVGPAGPKRCRVESYRAVNTILYSMILSVNHLEALSRLIIVPNIFISVPRINTSTIDPRAFAISSPSVGNCLPVDLRDPGHTRLTFRRKLKTHMFNSVHLFSYFIIMIF